MDNRTTLGSMPYYWNKTHPDRIAIIHEGKQYTYRDLHNISLSFASYFAASGVKERDHVLIMGKNSADWLFSFFGLQMLGAVAVPVNPSYTTDEIAQIMAIVGAKTVITNEFHPYARQIEDIYEISKDYEVLYTNRGRQHPHLLELQVNIRPEDVACILLTSGTTGVSKGVQLTHKNLLHNASEVTRIAGWNESDRFLLAVPLFHCFGLSATAFCALCAGATLCILENTQSSNLLASVARLKISVLNAVPALFIVAMRHNDLTEYDLRSLKSGIVAGSPLSSQEYRAIRTGFGIDHLIQSYGQTETSPAITMTRPEDDGNICATSVGRVIDGCEIAIIDNNKNPLEVGEAGNIVVRGKNVMRGYINGNNVYTEKDWLCTGDIGLVDEAGNLFISGRTKDIIIRGGENISAIEIENVAKELDFIDQARALAQKDRVMGEEVCLHVSLMGEKDAKEAESLIREHIAQHLAKYKIPKYIMIHDALPANGTGKIDDKKLLCYMKKHLG